MKRLMIICEGETEDDFVKTCLIRHLLSHDVDVHHQLLSARPGHRGGGGVSVVQVVRHIRRVHRNFDYVTTLVDYYGFKGAKQRGKGELEAEISDEVTLRLGTGFDAAAIIPYVQMHEFEALLFSDVGCFDLDDAWTDQQRQQLAAIRAEFETPEDIDDSPQMAPSKRLGRVLPGYDVQKRVYGPLIAEQIGLDVIRRECRGFDAWLARLESLGNA